MLESYSAAQFLPVVWLATLLKRDPRTGVLEPAVPKFFTK